MSEQKAGVTSTLDPYFQCWEDAIRRDLLNGSSTTSPFRLIARADSV
jgi:hypothetical protein